MIFDSVYDIYRGVITYVRVVDGKLTHRDRIKMMSTGATHELLELGVISPEQAQGRRGRRRRGRLPDHRGEGRPPVPGRRHVTTQHHGATEALGGYRTPTRWSTRGCTRSTATGSDLREALEKLELNDAALSYEPETSGALGFGFRCGFLGLLHMEITRDRLEREFDLDLISTAPNVVYDVLMEDGSQIEVTNPSEFPEGKIAEVREPVVRATILSPSDFIGTIMELCQARAANLRGWTTCPGTGSRCATRCRWARSSSTSSTSSSRAPGLRVAWTTRAPASRPADLVKVDILLQGEPVDAFSAIVHREAAYGLRRDDGREAQELIPRQQFEVPIQAAIGAEKSSPARTSGRSARTCSPSATAATSPASASCWRSRRRARSG